MSLIHITVRLSVEHHLSEVFVLWEHQRDKASVIADLESLEIVFSNWQIESFDKSGELVRLVNNLKRLLEVEILTCNKFDFRILKLIVNLELIAQELA